MYNNELYHYGVKGMKWGRRKKYYNSDGSLNRLGKARQDYKDSVKATRAARDNRYKTREANETYSSQYNKMVQKKAEYNALKAKNEKKAQKAEFKTYTKSMVDTVNNHEQRYRLYDDIKARKGKTYADKVMDNVGNESLKQTMMFPATMLGMAAAASIIVALMPE